MLKKTKLLDANIILRFLTQDNKKKSAEAEKIFKKAKKEGLEIPDFILTEIVWVLLSFYKLTKEEVVEKLEGICSFEKFKLNRVVLRKAIEFYRNYSISFVDAYLCAQGATKKQKVYSFDKRLNKVLSMKRKVDKK